MRPLALISFLAFAVHSAPIPVRQTQGAAQGFLVVRDVHGRQVGTGNAQQTTHGGTVTSRVAYTFDDGSIDEETTVFTQSRVFRVISDHHTQRGPIFSSPLDVAFNTATGSITSRQADKSGVKERQKDMPTDLANGIVGTILLNVPPTVPPFEVSMIAPSSKGRMIKIKISPEGEETFTVSGVPYKATVFRIHPELGGLTGLIAPAIGKEPKDVMVWVTPGRAPALVREIGQLSTGGPVFSIELAGAHFEPLQPEAKK